jgi:hypothetical protein
VAVDLANQRGRSLAAAAVSFLQDVEDDYEPAASRVALLLAPAKGASALDVAVAAALKVRLEVVWLVMAVALCSDERRLLSALESRCMHITNSRINCLAIVVDVVNITAETLNHNTSGKSVI